MKNKNSQRHVKTGNFFFKFDKRGSKQNSSNDTSISMRKTPLNWIRYGWLIFTCKVWSIKIKEIDQPSYLWLQQIIKLINFVFICSWNRQTFTLCIENIFSLEFWSCSFYNGSEINRSQFLHSYMYMIMINLFYTKR